MAQLVFIDGRNMGNVVALGATNTLGRARDCSVVLGDPTVQERHASILYREGAYRIRAGADDCKVAVNGREVRDEALRHGDIISIGEVTILFSDESAAHGKASAKGALPGDLPETIVQTRLPMFESAEEVVTTFRRKEPLARHLETLYRVGAALNSTLRLDELVDQLLAIVFDVLVPDRAFILLHDETGALQVRGERVNEKCRLRGLVRVSRSVLNEAVERREAILTKDATQDERFSLRQSIVEQNIQSAMCVPLIKKDRILGVIYIDTLTRARSYSEVELHLVNGIAAQAAVAVENVLHYDRSVEYSRKLATLGEVSRRISSFLSREAIIKESVQSASALFGCRRCSLLLAKGEVLTVAGSSGIDPKLWDEIRIAPGEGFCGKVFSENTPLLVRDASRLPDAGKRPYESKSFLIVPVVARPDGIQPGSRPIGVVAVTDKETGGIFTTDDQEVLVVFAAQIGIALQNATLFEKATVDTLTRLHTRQYLFARADEILAQNRGGTLSLLMCDLDHFKEKNDRYGHQMGDEILAQAGRILKEKAPDGLCARYGGEELVVLLPGRTREQARQVAEEIRKTLEAHNFGEPEPIRCTLSIGVAEMAPADAAETLLRKADHAMYAAKFAGRNRVAVFEGTEPPPATKSGIVRLRIPTKP
ncbi:MAG: diguanylate cyclase [Planctomycetes bacterium]|nr:diguanylate cyclase [Planctomycetota bacterium]